MYCTAIQYGVHCNTAFSWRTGRVVTGHIHNPHFIELQHRNGVVLRSVGDVPCGGMPTLPPMSMFIAKLSTIVGIHNIANIYAIRPSLERMYREFGHLVQYVIPPMQVLMRDHDIHLRNLRVKYLMAELSKEDMTKQVFKKYMENQTRMAQYHVYDLASVVGIDAYLKVVRCVNDFSTQPNTLEAGAATLNTLRDILSELEDIRLYCNSELAKISAMYSITVRYFTPMFVLENAKFKLNGEMTAMHAKRKLEA
jgi:hypothetical protein